MASTESSASAQTLTRDDLARALKERATRGMLLYNSGGDYAHLEADLWAVRASQGGWWHVDLEEESCSCSDYEHFGSKHGVPCKHVFSIALAHAARRSHVAVRSTSGAGDPFRLAGSRRLHELLDVVKHDSDEQAREQARAEIARLRRLR